MTDAPPKAHRLDLSAITHCYASVQALADIELTIQPGELVALLGPSGCGKTTLLKIIAGFVFPTGGAVLVDGAAITGVPADRRNVGIVFQNYALFPHLDVVRNVGYGLRARGIRGAAHDQRVAEMLALVKMTGFEHRYPGELSGGQQQRVALARALAVQPRIMLLDEPFSALDRGLRLDMQIEVKSLLKTYGITSILVTHDQEEALSMADRIVVLRDGRIEQVGTASDLYDRPATLFVNRFLGQSNLLPGAVASADGGRPVIALACGARITLAAASPLAPGMRVMLSVRPENLRPVAAAGPATIAARVRLNAPLGPTDVTELELADGSAVKIARPHRREQAALAVGEDVRLAIDDPGACALFPAEDGATSAARLNVTVAHEREEEKPWIDAAS